MNSLERLSRWVGLFSLWLGGLLLMINIGDIVMGVVLRYFCHAAPIWTEELARFSLVWMVLIGAAAAFLNGDQMSIDFVVNALPPRGKAFCRFLSAAVQVAVLGVMVWFGAQNVMGGWKMKTMALGVPKAVPLTAVPVGMAMLMVVVVGKYLHDSGSGREKR
ncbi:TRAP transporter small permease [Pyramidobacter porci]